MPAKFGSIFRAHARPSALNKNAVELIILSQNSLGNVVVAPNDLKENLKKYLGRFRMFSDAVEVLDGEILNIAIDFRIMTNPDFNKSEVLSNCILELREHFDISKWQINQPINLTDLTCLLADVPGVLTVYKLNIINRVGNFENRTYSNTPYNIKDNTKNGVIYCKPNAIFEIKFTKDISGAAR